MRLGMHGWLPAVERLVLAPLCIRLLKLSRESSPPQGDLVKGNIECCCGAQVWRVACPAP